MTDLLGEIRGRGARLTGSHIDDCGESSAYRDRRTLLRLLDVTREELADTIARVDRVRTIHNRAECCNVRCELGGWCIGCDPDGDEPCSEHPWPCPTVLALEPDAKLPDQYAAWVLKRDHDAVKAERDRVVAENRLLRAARRPPLRRPVQPAVWAHAPHRWLPNRVALECPGIPKPGEARDDHDGEDDD